ncbi:trans-acting enoyl reductase family protein [Ferrimonas sp. SCSIO 43195]|uniref:saccharopine dehydrogenase family protein n=1 Tax=Ferrimonas sp. SCSIO 43195 TaxID=2822844 RepID=UPI002075471D|nr:saccharopine dehydrogenase NADP-binding domain-containing protein [Ferrimonas sp. SCSIO 43195]USD36124.1 saccharopine dehydrogenase NADP-binding domain-containing protein [Ferrimonas sp. SCSIO 43195]
MTASNWMIYGANGYTGKLIAEEAKRRGLTPVLAGRNPSAIEALAQLLDLPYRCFDLNAISDSDLADIDLVLHCAGPFSATAEPMMQACIAQGCHYLDITGEVAVFELGQRLSDHAKAANVVLIPGVGFDVIPTDCVAARLKQAMPDATRLTLAFDSRSGFSRGTAKTSAEALPKGSMIRHKGKLVATPLAHKTRTIAFADTPKLAVSIPWGDLSTAWFSTAIDNIEVYIPMSARKVKQLKRINWVRGLMGLNWVQTLIKNRIEASLTGPSDRQRARHTTVIWGEVQNDKGEQIEARLDTANGYDVTVTGALAVTEFLLQNPGYSGYHTPSTLMGWQLVETLPGSGQIRLSGDIDAGGSDAQAS